MDLVKAHLDIGLYTNNKEDMLLFWQGTIGLPFDHLGKLGGGVHQLRHFLGNGPTGPILKINHARDLLLEPGPSGYRELLIARDNIGEVQTLTDPDGNIVTLVPTGHLGITCIGVRMKVRKLQEFDTFYHHILDMPAVPEAGNHAYRCGETIVIAEEDKALPYQEYQQAKGYRYITAQIQKTDIEHLHILSQGGTEGMPPRTLGDTVKYSFVRDMDGNWIELSQRATLTGTLE